jgi:N-hydroxyarylamine O-acetyltransferase
MLLPPCPPRRLDRIRDETVGPRGRCRNLVGAGPSRHDPAQRNAGPREPTHAALRGIVAGHATSIPFENVDVLLGRGAKLDPEALFEKIVERRRGGYCFEHNSLLLRVLEGLGFAAEGLAARVLWNQPEGKPGPRTHMLLRVALPEGVYLTDVGFGGLTLTTPLRLEIGPEQPTPHELHRLVPMDDEIELQARLDSGWTRLYHFTLKPQLPIDYEVANWFTATYPGGLFTNNLLMARPDPERRHAMFNRDFTIRPRGGPAERRTLQSADELGDVLAQHFRLPTDPADVKRVWEKIAK